MKIKEIRAIDIADNKPAAAGCGPATGDGLDKPPC